MKSDKLYLTHILECIQRIESYTQDGHDAFINHTWMQDAVIRNFEVIGEATKRISQGLKQAYPNIPWREMAGLRDVLIHDYFKVELDKVWEFVQADLPDLKLWVEAILREITEGDHR